MKTRIPKRFGLNPIRDIQVLCPMNRGGVGARSLNIELQAALNPAGERKVERFGWTFAPGDKVMQIENDYDKEVYNGDIGYIVDVDPEAGELVASFDGRSVTYAFGELDRLGSRLRRYRSQEPGFGVSGGDHPGHDPALSDVAAEPAVHWRHPRQAPRRPRRPEEGRRDRSQERLRSPALVETRRVVAARILATTTGHHDGGRRMTGPGFPVDNPALRRWMGDVEPAWNSLAFESFNALRHEPSATNRALTLASDLALDELEEVAPDFRTTGLVGGSLLRKALNGAEHDEDTTED